ncbi:MAG: VOC family protein [Rhodopila sp.]
MDRDLHCRCEHEPSNQYRYRGRPGTSVPDLSIEVDNLDQVYRRILEAGVGVEYGPTVEPWGVRRFFVRNPFGHLLDVFAHE